MKFGAAIPNSALYCNAKILAEVPKLAEKLGFDYFLLPDHFLWSWEIKPGTPLPHSPDDYAANKSQIRTLANQLGRDANFTSTCHAGLALPDGADPAVPTVDPTGFEVSICAKKGSDCTAHVRLIEVYEKAECEVYIPMGCYPPNQLAELMRKFASVMLSF